MSTLQDIAKSETTIARLERHYAMAQIKKRKQETRRKIELGGLVVKATLDHYPKDVILGILIDALELMEQDPAQEKVFARKGRKAFLED